MEQEQWKPIEGTDNDYEVSNLGRVRSMKQYYGVIGRIMPQTIQRSGYHYVMLHVNNKPTCRRVHRLVAKAFIPNPDNLPEINHIDGNKQNNAASNLEWATRRENTIHAYANGLINPMRNGTPCIFCGALTRSNVGCCLECKPKVFSVIKRMKKEEKQKEKYAFCTANGLTDMQKQAVARASRGMRSIDIARELGVSRQRVDQLLDRALEKQERPRS